jgi:hypothetical protein
MSLTPPGETLLYLRNSASPRLSAASGTASVRWPTSAGWQLAVKERMLAWREPTVVNAMPQVAPSAQLFTVALPMPRLTRPDLTLPLPDLAALSAEARNALGRFSTWQAAVSTLLVLATARQLAGQTIDPARVLPEPGPAPVATVQPASPRLVRLPTTGDIDAAVTPLRDRLLEQLARTADTSLAEIDRVVLGGEIGPLPVFPVSDTQAVAANALPASLAIFERFRPPADWETRAVTGKTTGIYAPTNEYWRDDAGRYMKIEDGFAITKIPQRVAPIYDHVEQVFGISKYILMAVATIESKQGTSTVSPTNCQGWGHFCPGTIRLFQGKQLLPAGFNTYDPYDGIAGIAVHLWVSALGVGEYKNLLARADADGKVPWPRFWDGETPAYADFENMNRGYPFIPALWGYNRSSFYGYSVIKLAKFYQEQDQATSAR